MSFRVILFQLISVRGIAELTSKVFKGVLNNQLTRSEDDGILKFTSKSTTSLKSPLSLNQGERLFQ